MLMGSKMNTFKSKKHRFGLLPSILFLFVLPIFGIGAFWQVQSATASNSKIIRASDTAILDPVLWKKYAPATYGLPDVIAGYRVIGITSHENTPCLPEGYKQIVLEVPEARAGTSDEMIKGFDMAAVERDMSLYSDAIWSYVLGGTFLPAPPILLTRARFVIGSEDWNALIQQTGCYRTDAFKIPALTSDS